MNFIKKVNVFFYIHTVKKIQEMIIHKQKTKESLGKRLK